MTNLTVLLFEDFETLDVFGPVEIFGRLKDHYSVVFCSLEGGLVSNYHGVSILTKKLEDQLGAIDIFLIPGGYGTRKEIYNAALLELIKKVAGKCKYVLTVCTGTALLAIAGLLDEKHATSNKKAFAWVKGTGEKVLWNARARWVVDDKFYTSSGVSAGMDMSLSFIADTLSYAIAKQAAKDIEYLWIEEKDNDSFVALLEE